MGLFERLSGDDKTGTIAFWLSLVANTIGLPGLGSMMLRRRVGLRQMAVSIVGLVLVNLWIFGVLLHWIDTEMLSMDYSIGLWQLVAGTALFALAWIWALATSLSVWRACRRQPVEDSSRRE